MSRSELPFDSVVATGKGDDGTTGLLFGGARVRKDDPRTDAYGTVDEAVAALGLARAEIGAGSRDGVAIPSFGGLGETILRIQRELFVVGAELATNPEARDRQKDDATRVSRAMVDAIGETLAQSEASIVLPTEFVVPGETRVSAALELARTITRRAERRVVTLAADDPAIAGGHILPYLNRLADLLWVLARMAEQAEARDATVARPGRSRGRRSAAPSPAQRSE
ncbi:MAG TPA: cob(I)yrinic acid a,c-diamide adenosyltransferase [Candidatus Limnocylindrales bacterium]|nr:cob(I)yrinic acid a,c-diamide adenosyltransferase [Candidatus Limnocylindrales bacterium]